MIDGGIGLDQVFHQISAGRFQKTSGCGDDADGDRVFKVSERRTDRDSGLPRFQKIGISKLGDCRHFPFHFQYRQVGEGIGADELRLQDRAVGKLRVIFTTFADNMVVGQNISVFTDNDSAAHGGGVGGSSEVSQCSRDHSRDGHDCRRDFFHDPGDLAGDLGLHGFDMSGRLLGIQIGDL